MTPARDMPKSHLVRISLAFTSVLPIATYPVLFAYFHNSGEASFSQVWHPLGIFAGVAACLLILFSTIAADLVRGAFVANVAVFLFSYYRPIEEFLRDIHWHIRYWHLVPSLLAVLVVLTLSLRSAGGKGQQTLRRANRATALVFTLLILFNAGMALPGLIGKVRMARRFPRVENGELLPDASRSNHYPNVYYILLDEYSSFDMIQKHYGYDNSAFATELESMGFTVSRTSRNPSPRTPEILAHLIGMNSSLPLSYRVDEDGYLIRPPQSLDLYHEIISESRLTRFFKSRGYEVYVADMGRLYLNHPDTLISDHYYSPDPTGQASPTPHNTLYGVTLSRSALYVLDWQAEAHFYNRMVNGIFEWIVSQGLHENPLFLYAHILCPHAPFSFDRNGRSIFGGEDWDDKGYYLGQFIYVTDRISGIVRHLVEGDPDCVIILQSDHSARMWVRGIPDILPVADMTPILNAVYFRGLPLDIEGRTGLDTGLTVYGRLFGLDFQVEKDR